ncbi:hypothetical protein MPAR168_20410 [Methylorubrum populi]|uniref:Putative Flp pilus-assembly TadG-like N-terminal domain-containing protein n=1 Tax=Methylobacterium radiotolerans TaxID=31998 RepID=A0ABU7T8Z5_9HYPH
MVRPIQRLAADEGGAIVVIFCLMLPLMVGVTGMAVDFGSALRVRTVERRVADAAALLIANAETPDAATQAIALAKADLAAQLGTRSDTGGYTVQGQWLDSANYRLTISVRVKTSLINLVPGMPKELVVSTATTVNRIAPQYETVPPTMSQLSPEAADYNRVYFYCYSTDPARQKSADGGRREITLIADNADPPTVYDLKKMPKCQASEVPSYMLRNVRDARTQPRRWDEVGNNTYEYYTDVTIDPITRVQTFNLKGYNLGKKSTVDLTNTPILETIICDTEIKCRTAKSKGGDIPDRKTNRNPLTATTSCLEGKYMYYGWEDRPGGDRDYDDIRLVISCPKQIKVVDKQVRIVE